jgi:hypothetical protein
VCATCAFVDVHNLNIRAQLFDACTACPCVHKSSVRTQFVHLCFVEKETHLDAYFSIPLRTILIFASLCTASLFLTILSHKFSDKNVRLFVGKLDKISFALGRDNKCLAYH